jgi:hypothetical protein
MVMFARVSLTNVLGASWLVVCAIGGGLLFSQKMTTNPDDFAPFIPLWMFVWVVCFFVGRAILASFARLLVGLIEKREQPKIYPSTLRETSFAGFPSDSLITFTPEDLMLQRTINIQKQRLDLSNEWDFQIKPKLDIQSLRRGNFKRSPTHKIVVESNNMKILPDLKNAFPSASNLIDKLRKELIYG